MTEAPGAVTTGTPTDIVYIMKDVGEVFATLRHWSVPDTDMRGRKPAEFSGMEAQLAHAWRTGDRRIADSRQFDDEVHAAAARTAMLLRPGLHQNDPTEWVGLGRRVGPRDDVEKKIVAQTFDKLGWRPGVAETDRQRLTAITACEAVVLTALGIGDPEAAKNLLTAMRETAPDIADAVTSRVASSAARVLRQGTGEPLTALELARKRYDEEGRDDLAAEVDRLFPQDKPPQESRQA